MAFATLGLLLATARARADGLDKLERVTWDQGFSSRGHELKVDVPVVPQEGARALSINYELLEALGIGVPENYRRDPKWEGGLLQRLVLRPSAWGEQPTQTAVATRYRRGGDGQGVQGDGRAAHTADVVVRDPDSGKVLAVFEIQTKGFPTGLAPQGWRDHGHGREPEKGVIGDGLMAHFLSVNGVRSEESVLMADTPVYIRYADGAAERAGQTIRGGSYLRVASLHSANDRGLGREMLDFINAQLAMELGREAMLSQKELFTALSQRMADNLARMFWLRVSHGSVTSDNTGLLRMIDMGTVTHMDRSHWEHAFFAGGALGRFGTQPNKWFYDYFAAELMPILKQNATPLERAELDAIENAAEVGMQLFRSEMSYRALLHAGFSKHEARAVASEHPGEAAAFLDAVVRVASYQNKGATHRMGPNGEELVNNPARYDVYGAVAGLARAFRQHHDHGGRVAALQRDMSSWAPGGPVAADHQLADALVSAFGALVERRLQGLSASQREGTLRLMENSAGARNRHVPGLVRAHLEQYAAGVASRIEGGEDIHTLHAELEAFKRQSNIVGKNTALDAAWRVAANRVETRGNGELVLSTVKESGVAIRQLSSGDRDVVEVTLVGDPLAQREQGGYRMRFTTRAGDHGWEDAAPVAHDSDRVTFRVDVTDKPREALEGFRAAFWHTASGKNGRWENNAGVNFGVGVQNVFGDANVQGALALHARRVGKQRATSTEVQQLAEALQRAYSAPRRPGVLEQLGIKRGRGVAMQNPTAHGVRTWRPQGARR